MRGNCKVFSPQLNGTPLRAAPSKTDCPRLSKNKLNDLQKMKSSTRAISRLRKNVDVAIPQAPA